MPVDSPTLGDPVDVGDLVARVQRDLRGDSRSPFDLLAGTLTAGTTDEAVTVSYGIPELSIGALVGIGEEILLVRSVSGTTVTLARGLFNSNVTTHAVGDVVEVNPRFFANAVGDTVVEEIRSWPVDLYRVREDDIDFGAVDEMVEWDAPVGYRRLLDSMFFETSGDHYIDLPVDVTAHAPTATYPSGFAVRRTSHFTAGVVHLVYGADFTLSAVTLATTLATVGLTVPLYDIVYFGAMYRLLAPREAEAIDPTSQPQPRMSRDTPPRATFAAAAGFKQLRDERISQEITRLRDLYPGRF